MEKAKQLRFTKLGFQKDTVKLLVLGLAVFLLFYPFINTINELLTNIAISFKGYRVIREYVVPFETRFVAVILKGLGYSVAVTSEYVVLGTGSRFFAEIIWNCIGWQSLLYFIVTVLIVFQGERYTLFSKVKAVILGVIGTFLINIFRIVAVVLAIYHLGQGVGSFVHNNASLLVNIVWLGVFWWFSFGFVMEESEQKLTLE